MDTVFNRINRSDHQQIAEITRFLRANDLNIDTTVEVFITVSRNEKLVACGGLWWYCGQYYQMRGHQ